MSLVTLHIVTPPLDYLSGMNHLYVHSHVFPNDVMRKWIAAKSSPIFSLLRWLLHRQGIRKSDSDSGTIVEKSDDR